MASVKHFLPDTVRAIQTYGNVKSVCRNILSPSYGATFDPVSRSKSTEAVKLLTYNKDVIGSNVSQDTIYSGYFIVFLSPSN
jgi:hypothetical protein